jgi:hypothetical protein
VDDGDKSSVTDDDRSRFIDPEAVVGVGTVSAMILPGGGVRELLWKGVYKGFQEVEDQRKGGQGK